MTRTLREAAEAYVYSLPEHQKRASDFTGVDVEDAFLAGAAHVLAMLRSREAQEYELEHEAIHNEWQYMPPSLWADWVDGKAERLGERHGAGEG